MQRLLPLLNRAAATWFSFVYHITWQASLLAVLLLAVVLLGRRWPSPLRYWLLVLALAKFALPPLLSMPTGLFSRVGPAVEAVPIEANFPTVALANPTIMDSATPLGGIPVGSVPGKPSPGRTKPVAEPHTSAPVLDGKSWLMLLHISGAMVAACWILRSCSPCAVPFTARRKSPTANSSDDSSDCPSSSACGVRPASCYRTSLVDRPPLVCCGPWWSCPRRWPCWRLRRWTLILAHELAHHRRRDLWINWVQLALTAVWWFNPVLWVLNRQIRKVREDCCDDLLLTRNLTTGQAYCDTLLERRVQAHGTGDRRSLAGVWRPPPSPGPPLRAHHGPDPAEGATTVARRDSFPGRTGERRLAGTAPVRWR